MTQTAAAVVLGFLLASAYGAGFHLLLGGPARRILLYMFAAWLGFALGHVLGDMLQIDVLQLGVLQLLSASLGAWIALLASWWFVANESH